MFKLFIAIYHSENTITFAQDTFVTFYQKSKYFTGNKVKILIPKNIKLNSKNALFVISAINKVLNQISWGVGSTVGSIKQFKLLLPTKNGNIDYDFMDTFVAELEAQRVAELEAYLETTGLNDYELTDEEKEIINEFENTRWKKYKFHDIFNHIKQGKRLKKDDQISGQIPFVMSGITNNGVANYISNPIILFPSNSITIDIFGNVFYRNYPFSASDDIGVYWTDKYSLNTMQMLYLATAMSKSLKGKYSYGKKLRSSRSYNITIKLPIKKDDKIDFDYMEKYITAIEKLTIKNVVEYKDKLIEQAKKLVN